MTGKKWTWLVGGFLVGLVLVLILTREEKSPELTEQLLDQARETWQVAGLKNYRMNVTVGGDVSEDYSITVRDGNVSAMTVNGMEAEERLLKFWSVEGMFLFLEQELINRKQKASVYGATGDDKVYLDAKFNKQWGYPEKFLRQVTGKNVTIQWKVSMFDSNG